PSCVSSLSRTASRNRSQSRAKRFWLERISKATGLAGDAFTFKDFRYFADHWSTYASNSFTSARIATTLYRENAQCTVASTSSRGTSPPYLAGSHTLIGKSAPSSIRHATNAVWSWLLEPSNPSVIRSPGCSFTSDWHASHS